MVDAETAHILKAHTTHGYRRTQATSFTLNHAYDCLTAVMTSSIVVSQAVLDEVRTVKMVLTF
jgi:hypothetical protein